MSDKSENIGDFTTNEKGQNRFAKGNKIGRMPKKGLTLLDLTKLAIKLEKKYPEKDPLPLHYLKRAFKNDKILSDIMNKYMPPTTKNELTGADGSPLSITLNKVIYADTEKKDAQD